MNPLRQVLSDLLQSFPAFWTEILLVGLLVLLVLLDLIFKRTAGKIIPWVGFAGLIVVASTVFGRQGLIATTSTAFFLGLLRLDGIAISFKYIFLLAGLLTILISQTGNKLIEKRLPGEFFTLLVAAILGLHLMAMSVNLLSIYLAVELVSISSYILTALLTDRKASEGGLKYLLFGAMSSGVMLYGMSWLYGFTGSLNITEPDFYQALAQIPAFPLLLTLFLTVAGFLFKIGAAPFHVWTPDAYEAAPLPAVAFFSVAPKAAGLAVLLRLVSPVTSLKPEIVALFVQGLCLIILLTLTIGNFSALWQRNVRRLLAYSSIAHAGFLLIGVAATSLTGTQSLLFYVSAYVFMNFAAFLLVGVAETQTHSQMLSDYQGIGQRLPLFGVAFTVVMLALAGLPPTVGFTAKLFVFSALWETYQTNHQSWLLVVFGVGLLNVAVSLFYYLKIPFLLFFRSGDELNTIRLGIYEGSLIALMTVLLVVFFFKADWIIQFIQYTLI